MRRKDYIFTLMASGVQMVGMLMLYKMSVHFYGTVGFSEYSLVRRIISFLVPTFALGMVVGLPREVARVSGSKDDKLKYLLLQYSVVVVCLLGCLLLVFTHIFAHSFSLLLFSGEKYSYLLIPMDLCVLGVLFNSIAYSYYRGLDRINVSNCLLVINMVIVPVIIMPFAASVQQFFLAYGVASIIVSLGFIAACLCRAKPYWNLYEFARFMYYSVRRVPGDICFQLIFVVPPIVGAHIAGIVLAGRISFGLSFMSLITFPLGPVSTLLLPQFVKVLSSRNKMIIRNSVNKLLIFAILFASLAAVVLFVFAPFISEFITNMRGVSTTVIRYVAIASVPFAVYIVLRSIIDAGSRKAYNSLNTFVAFVVFCVSVVVIQFYLRSMLAVFISINLSFYCLGLLSYMRTRFILSKNHGVI